MQPELTAKSSIPMSRLIERWLRWKAMGYIISYSQKP